MGTKLSSLRRQKSPRHHHRHRNKKPKNQFSRTKICQIFAKKVKTTVEAEPEPKSPSPVAEEICFDCPEIPKPTQESVTDTEIPSFQCEICTEQRPLDSSFNVKRCSHFFCNQCVISYVISKLEDGVTLIGCPSLDCDGSLDPDYCRFILPHDVFSRWGIALCESVISESQKFYCPYKDCSALLINDRTVEERRYVDSTCHYCNRKFCVKCKEPWHELMDCKKFQKLKEKGKDAFVEDLAKRNRWRRCPNCHVYVERTRGCYYIKCRCGFAFCYNCGARSETHNHYCSVCMH